MTAEDALLLYEQRQWEHAVRAAPRGILRRRLFCWMWRHRLNPPYPGKTLGRVILFMRVIELRNERRLERLRSA
jgi:hypothetical protein